jgi:hypothetical protein
MGSCLRIIQKVNRPRYETKKHLQGLRNENALSRLIWGEITVVSSKIAIYNNYILGDILIRF